MQIAFRILNYHSPDYAVMYALRDEVLLKPVGFSFSTAEREAEANDFLIGGFLDNEMIACCILTPRSDTRIQLRQMAVARHLQGKNIGSSLMQFAEQIALEKGFSTLFMHARETACGFYKTLNYSVVG
ncbi:MAG: GNAT family N-acetyltransferase, partial [Bacteroidia bacterium]